MTDSSSEAGDFDLAGSDVVRDAPAAVLYEHVVKNAEGSLVASGALSVDTGVYTGRSPGDKYIVRNAATADDVDWGSTNRPMAQASFDLLLADMKRHMHGKRLYVQDVQAGTPVAYRLNVRVVTEYAWHSLFTRNLFISGEAAGHRPDWVVVDLPSFKADPQRHGSSSSTVIAMDFQRKLVLIANTEYAGEIKKSIFTALNLDLPRRSVFPMHCSANEDEDGRVALFFGLSGTGKTTLSADGDRRLIGDDEHGWSADGIFNFEGGCYAKVVNLSARAEPEIYAASHRFGTVLENVKIDTSTRLPDFVDISKTENTRAAYPIDFMPNASTTGTGDHPADVVFLTADAFGVLPPISRLDVAQAMYQFLSGYTAKVAGTERGVTEPQATFSACFGAPFMPLPAVAYAEMLGERLRRYGSRAWLVNTGWTGGGSRVALAATRTMVRAALSGALDDAPTQVHDHFGLNYVTRVPGVDPAILDPRTSWSDGTAYEAAATKLVKMFVSNFESFAAHVPAEVLAAGPR
jgi:phosphoenolpyruvate carboxykinase (ATP)